MKKEVPLSLFGMVGSAYCVSSADGQKVFRRLATAINDGKKVAVSFANVEYLTSAFLNAAIGQLYGHFAPEHIRRHVRLVGISKPDATLLKRVVENARAYFADPEKFEKARDTAMSEAG